MVSVVLYPSVNFCVGNIKHIKATENELDLECILRTRWALFCTSSQSPSRKFSILTAISKSCPPLTVACEETSTVTSDSFFQVIAKNSLIKNIFEEEKKFKEHMFFFENSSVLGVFGPRRELQANHGTVRKRAIPPQPGNQERLKRSNTAYLNKRSFIFSLKFCVFQVTET